MLLQRSLPFPNSTGPRRRIARRTRPPPNLWSRIPRRLQYIFLTLFVCPSSFWLAYYTLTWSRSVGTDVIAPSPATNKRPPNYYEWHEKEKAMPQNDPELPPPQGRHGRYVRFRNWWDDAGWGNALQEIIVHAHIAYKADRIFTMYNYTWNKQTQEDYWTFDYGDRHDVVPARIPLTAFLEGPIAGDPFPSTDWRPPAVTTEFFEEVCPHPTVIAVGDAKGVFHSSTAATILGVVVEKLNSIEDSCVEFLDNSGQIFNYELFGNGARMADAWPQLLESPILTEWRWSKLATSGLEHNRKLIHPSIIPDDLHRSTLPGLLALHVRRGDFQQHCDNLATWHSNFNAWNVYPGFPDVYDPPQISGDDDTDWVAWYRRSCYPEVEQIVTRVEEVRADATKQGRSLDRIYVLTNGAPDWLAELKTALRKSADWKSIATSRDLIVTWEQKFVSQVIDQIIGTRAEVFVGNPWSSMSSNINLLRIAQYHEPETCRLW